VKNTVAKRICKDVEKIPLHAKIAADEVMSKIEHAADFIHLCEITDIVHMEGTNEPYYRLRFNQYRFMLYYDIENETLEILSLTHRKDSYKKHKLPWRW